MITVEQLLEVFATYNPQIWPMQIVAYVLGIVCVYLAVRKTAFSGRCNPCQPGLFLAVGGVPILASHWATRVCTRLSLLGNLPDPGRCFFWSIV